MPLFLSSDTLYWWTAGKRYSNSDVKPIFDRIGIIFKTKGYAKPTLFAHLSFIRQNVCFV